MVLKGNLLYNGDFETGTTEGWVNGPFGLNGQLTLSAKTDAKYKGNYGGELLRENGGGLSAVAYNKTANFEEYEGYLYILHFNMLEGFASYGLLFALDDKENLITNFTLGYNVEKNIWRKCQAILRGFGDITHFQVGLYYSAFAVGDKLYFDEAKLIPLKSIKSHVLSEYRSFTNVTANKIWYSVLACVGRCQLRSIVRTENVSGTSPTLDVSLKISLLDDAGTYISASHSQFTSEDIEEISIDLPEVSIIRVDYTLGGTDPSFDIYHHLRIYPY